MNCPNNTAAVKKGQEITAHQSIDSWVEGCPWPGSAPTGIELVLASADSKLVSSLDIVLLSLVQAQGFRITKAGRRQLEGGGA